MKESFMMIFTPSDDNQSYLVAGIEDRQTLTMAMPWGTIWTAQLKPSAWRALERGETICDLKGDRYRMLNRVAVTFEKKADFHYALADLFLAWSGKTTDAETEAATRILNNLPTQMRSIRTRRAAI